MPYEKPDREPPRQRRREDPAGLPLEAVLKRLGTDPEVGLSPREAEKRRTAESSAGRLYTTDTLGLRGCIRRLCREPILWIFLAVCLSALLFSRVAIGVACLCMTLAYGAICTLCYVRTEKIDAAMQTGEMPLCRVLRNGHVRRVSVGGIVRGDILLLYPGDTVPVDACIIETDGQLVLLERELSGDPDGRRTIRLRKDASAVAPTENALHSPDNMVYAGGTVERGRARVVVVATGADTHLGALTGGLPPVHRRRPSAALRRAERWLNILSLALLVLVIPLTALGILTLGGRYDLLDIVLVSLTPALTAMTGHILLRAAFVGASLRESAAELRNTACTADIRTAETLDGLDRVDELVLVGTAGLHDGIPHPEYLTVGRARYDCTRPGADADATRCATYAFLYAEAMRRTPPGRLPVAAETEPRLRESLALLEALAAWAELSPEAVHMRVQEVTPLPSASPDDLPAVRVTWNDGSREELRLYRDTEEIAGIETLPGRVPSGASAPLRSDDGREALRHACRQARLAGLRTCVLLSTQPEGTCLEGLMAYAPHSCRKTEGAVRALQAEGLEVTVFLRDVSEENARVLAECGFSASMTDRPTPETAREPASLRRRAGALAFEGCDTAYILEYLRDRQQAGAHLLVLSGDARDRRILEAADVGCTICPPGLYRTAMERPVAMLEPETCTAGDGDPDASCATDGCRRCADVVVRRVSPEGGGVLGLRTALDTAARYRYAMESFWRFWGLSQLLRILMLLLPTCMGATLPEAPWMLLSGFFADMLALLSLALNDAPVSLSRRRRQVGLRAWLISHLDDLIGLGAAVAALWGAVGVAKLQMVNFGTASLSVYVGVSVLSLQLALYLSDRILCRRTRSGWFFLLGFLLLWVGTLAVGLGSGLRLYWSLVFPLGGGILFLLIRVLARGILRALRRSR